MLLFNFWSGPEIEKHSGHAGAVNEKEKRVCVTRVFSTSFKRLWRGWVCERQLSIHVRQFDLFTFYRIFILICWIVFTVRPQFLWCFSFAVFSGENRWIVVHDLSCCAFCNAKNFNYLKCLFGWLLTFLVSLVNKKVNWNNSVWTKIVFIGLERFLRAVVWLFFFTFPVFSNLYSEILLLYLICGQKFCICLLAPFK